MTAARQWSRCGACQRAEYNDILVRQQCFCACGKKVVLFSPSPKSRKRDQQPVVQDTKPAAPS
eukprot:7417321-Pyramimonas_sp.AAC.1